MVNVEHPRLTNSTDASAGLKAVPSWNEMSFVHAGVNSSLCISPDVVGVIGAGFLQCCLVVFSFVVNSTRLS